MDTKHLVRAAVPLAVGAVLLSACGGSSSGGNTGGGGGGKSFSIGYQGPLSGGNASLGINMVNGVQLALDQANAAKTLQYTLNLVKATVAGLRGDLLLATTYSRVAAKHRLAAWVRLLALTATRPDRRKSATRASSLLSVRPSRVRPMRPARSTVRRVCSSQPRPRRFRR